MGNFHIQSPWEISSKYDQITAIAAPHMLLSCPAGLPPSGTVQLRCWFEVGETWWNIHQHPKIFQNFMGSLPSYAIQGKSSQPDPGDRGSWSREEKDKQQKLHGSAAGNLPEGTKDTRNASQIWSVQWWDDDIVKKCKRPCAWKASCSQKMPNMAVSGHAEASTGIYELFHFSEQQRKRCQTNLVRWRLSVQLWIYISLPLFVNLIGWIVAARSPDTHRQPWTPTKTRESFGYFFG